MGLEKHIYSPKTTKKFSDSLASGFEVDRFNLSIVPLVQNI